jgi:hypothetical protein
LLSLIFFGRNFVDVHMTSPATSPLRGASRITGGTTRGRATGNIFNMADTAVEDIEMTVPRTGKVHLYTSLVNPAQVKPSRILKIDVQFSMGPVLKSIAAKFSPIQSMSNYLWMIL